MKIKLPYAKSEMLLELDESLDFEILESGIAFMKNPEMTEDEIVLSAMSSPIGSDPLRTLAAGKEKIVIICSDQTRPVPSKHIIPFMLKEIREGNPQAEVTLLIATGLHRVPTREELIQKFGEEIVEKETIVLHDSQDKDAMVEIGILPSGAPLLINRVAVEADLLVSEGFIETHFFAGFSGGRKSVLPGISSKETVLGNHCAEFMLSPYSRTGILDKNPVHLDMVAACQMAKLQYIVNVIIDTEKRIVHAVAGDSLKAHEAGCDFLKQYCQLTPKKKADIVVVTNGGDPFDQTMYQSVKGMTAAEASAEEGGIIIMAAHCGDGHGGEAFYQALAACESPQALFHEVSCVPQADTKPEQWEYQIQSRILMKHKVIYVMCETHRKTAEEMGFQTAENVNEALETALKEKGRNAHIAVIPDGVSVMILSK